MLSKGLFSGKFYPKSNKATVEFIVTKLEYLTDKIIPFFDKYQIIGVKSADYQDLKKVVELIKNKAHLTLEGLDQIQKIKAGMNRER